MSAVRFAKKVEMHHGKQVLVIIETRVIVQYTVMKFTSDECSPWHRSRYHYYMNLYINAAFVPINLHIVYILHARQLYRRSKRSTLNILELLESCSFYYAASQVSW